MEDVPIEILMHILKYLDINDLYNILQTNTYLYSILQEEYFWKEKFIHKYGISPFPVESWKNLSLGFDQSWTCGEIGINESYHYRPIKLFKNRCIAIASGYDFTLAIDEDHQIWGIGSNIFGQLGLGKRDSIHKPSLISDISAKDISAGVRHGLLIDMDDNVWAFGDNFCGQLGIGYKSNKYTPRKIPNIKASKVSGGIFHSLFLDLDGTLWSTGSNISGELGLYSVDTQYYPVKIPLDFKVKQIAAHGSFSMVIDDKDDLWMTGSNQYGQLGFQNPRSISYYKKVFQGVKKIAAGIYHSMLIDLEDNVWVTGDNSYGQLGLGDVYLDRIYEFRKIPNLKAKEISAGGSHSLIMDFNGELWGCGSNMYGQLGMFSHHIYEFRKIFGIKAQKISAGGCHTSFIGYY